MSVWYNISSRIPIQDVIDNIRDSRHTTLLWNRKGLSMNPGISARAMRIIDEDGGNRISGRWNWRNISSRVPIQDVYAYPDLPWSKRGLSRNPGITIGVLYLDLPMATGDWIWFDLATYLPISQIRRHTHLPWTKEGLSLNEDIQVQDILALSDLPGDWDWYILSQNIPIGQILTNPYMQWDYKGISLNPGFTLDLMDDLGMSVSDLDMRYLSKTMPIPDIRRYPYLPWNRIEMSSNPSITIDDVLYLDLPRATGNWNIDRLANVVPIQDIVSTLDPLAWDKRILGMNPTVRVYDLDDRRYPRLPGVWDMDELSRVMPMSEIRKHPYLSWSLYDLSLNPDISLDVLYMMLNKHRG